MSKQKRIVCYAINGAGLGHVTRLLSVAKWMRRYTALLDQRPAEVLFLTSSDASHVLAEAGFAAFKIPSKTIARKTELNKLEYRRLAKHFIWNTLGVFSPDLLVVDTFPSGSFDELFQVLDGPFRKSFIYRKVKPEYAARATFQSAASMYDTVVAPHSMENCPVEQVGGKNIQFSGEVVQFDPLDLMEAANVRRDLGVADGDRLVYISAGGGGDPNAQRQLESIVQAVKQFPNVHMLIGAGPLYRGPRTSGPKVTWYDGPAVAKYFAGIDVAISAAGYNTFHELLMANVPSAFFAQSKIADDQRERIQRALDVGACHFIEDLDDTSVVQETIGRLLDPAAVEEIRNNCGNVMQHNGARKCALQLLAPLYSQDRLQWAEHVLQPRLARHLETLTGSTSSISDWLVPLMPQDQAKSIVTQPAMHSVLSQLSDSAAAELRSVLDMQDNESGQTEFEQCLIALLDQVKQFDESQRTAVGKDVLKTILAVMKRNPLDTSTNTRAPWVCEIITSVSSLISEQVRDTVAIAETLQLYRTFPKIIDADVPKSLGLFKHLVAFRKNTGEANHEIGRFIQLLKMKHQKVTTEIIEDMIHNVGAEATFNG